MQQDQEVGNRFELVFCQWSVWPQDWIAFSQGIRFARAAELAGWGEGQVGTQNEHGFPLTTEHEELAEVADGAFALGERHEVLYFLRTSSKGVRTSWFYAKDGPAFADEMEQCYQGLASYRVEVEVQNDPEWKFYYEEVDPLPDFEREKQMLLLVLQQLHEAGDAAPGGAAIRSRSAICKIGNAEGFSVGRDEGISC